MPAPIIAAFDPYTDDRAPVALALTMGELTGSPVLAAVVYPWSIDEDRTDPYAHDGATQQVVNAAIRRLREDLGVETRIVEDLSVPRGLHELARELDAGLIVVGSTSRGTVGRVLVGSTAERLLQGAPCPVALAPRDYKPEAVSTVAVGFVDSPEGHEALTAAHLLAARRHARLRVVTAVHPSGGLDAAMAGGLRPQRGAGLEGRHRQEAEAALERAVDSLDPGVDIEADVHVDDPAAALLRVSQHVDLLVCGSRGYGPLRSILLGGVSRRLVDEAHCPVLVLPRGTGRPPARLIEDVATATTG